MSDVSTRKWTGAASINGGEMVAAVLVEETDVLDISTGLPIVDPCWRFSDAAGHFHAYDETSKGYPTLRKTVHNRECDSSSCDGACGGEGFTETTFACEVCGEEIEPGYLPGPHYLTTAGRTTWHLTVQADVPDRAPVSVRFEWRDRVWFGIATRRSGRMESGPFGLKSETLLVAASPLGTQAARQMAVEAT